MTTLKSGPWGDLTTDDFADMDPKATVAVLPIGAVEQHGPHLPLSTDLRIAEGVVRRTLEKAPDSVVALVLPSLWVGTSPEHADFPGTLSLKPETLLATVGEIGAGAAAAGVRKLVIVNSHGGQPDVVDQAAMGLRASHRMVAVKANTFRFGVPPGLFDEDELAHGIHGGAVETSLMLHLHPDLVRRDRVANFAPASRDLDRDFPHIQPLGRTGFAWMAQDLHPSGAAGDATVADAEKGRLLLEHMADVLVAIVEETARLPLSALRDRP